MSKKVTNKLKKKNKQTINSQQENDTGVIFTREKNIREIGIFLPFHLFFVIVFLLI